MTAVFDLKEIQGNILRGYRLNRVRHILLEVASREAARRFLAASADGTGSDVPAITRASMWAEKRAMRFNIGITFAGLRALQVSGQHLASFPSDFAEGMAARAAKLGDTGDSAPEHWPQPFDRPQCLHLIASVYADTEDHLDTVQAQVAKAFTVLGVRDGRNQPEGKVFFGYVDGISNPRFEGIADPDQLGVNEPPDPLGTALLGHRTSFEGLKFSVPTPHVLGHNGSFNAFRVLSQDVTGFEAWLDRAADFLLQHPDVDRLLPPGKEAGVAPGGDRRAALREVVAAQMCGRWRNGVPYELSPEAQYQLTPDGQWIDVPVSRTNYDYSLSSRCPAGAHMRRANPRGGPIVQRVANYTRRLVRRGMSYGPDFDPANPDDPAPGAERGLLGNFIGASISGQFEAVVCDWINLGLQDPDITGTNDPLLGANVPETSLFDLALPNGGQIRLSGFPRFVTTRGGAYAFLPSLPAIRYLSQLPG